MVLFISDQTNTGFMLGQRLRRWPNINPVLFRRLVLAVFGSCGIYLDDGFIISDLTSRYTE